MSMIAAMRVRLGVYAAPLGGSSGGGPPVSAGTIATSSSPGLTTLCMMMFAICWLLKDRWSNMLVMRLSTVILPEPLAKRSRMSASLCYSLAA